MGLGDLQVAESSCQLGNLKKEQSFVKWKRIAAGGISEAFFFGIKLSGFRKGFRVLLYHAVDSEIPHDHYGISIKTELFEKHMVALGGMENVNIVDLTGEHVSNTGLDVAITLDDGYRDTLYNAAPILLKYHIPFTVFATTSFIQSGSPLYLTPDELKELSSFEGVTIGSHGVTHNPLRKCDDKTLWKELHESRLYLEDLTEKPVTAVSYPHGSVDQRVRDTAEKAGYVVGGCSLYGINNESHDPLLLRRIEIIDSDSEKVFFKKVHGAWDWYGSFRKFING